MSDVSTAPTSPSSFAQAVPADVLAAASAGVEHALESLFRSFQRAVWTLALRLSDQRADAEEITQDAFLKAFQALPRYRGEAPFGMWLRQIVVNEALMRRRSRVPLAELPEVLPDTAAQLPGSRQLDLQRSLAALPQPTRGVLWLYYVEGYTHPEIAAAYGQSVSFSKSQVARGAERLRQQMAEPAGENTRPFGWGRESYA